MSVVKSFAEGFGLVDAYYDKEEDRARRDGLDQERQDDKARHQSNLDRQFDAQEKSRAQTQSNWEKSFTLQESNAEEANKHRSWVKSRTEQQDKYIHEDREHKKNLEFIQQSYALAEQGKAPDDHFWELVEQPRYRNADPRWLGSDEFGLVIEQGKKVLDPNSPDGLNDPASLEAINKLLHHEINSGPDMKELDGVRKIAQILPGKTEGTLVFKLQMEDGSIEPMTINRGSAADGDNVVLEEPLSRIVQKFAHADAMRQMVLSPQLSAMMGKHGRAAGYIPKPKSNSWKKLNEGALYNESDGTTKVVDPKASKGSKGSNSQKKYQEMLELGIPGDIAKGISYGTIKTIKDPATGAASVVDVATGKTIGGMVPSNPEDPFSELKWQGSSQSSTRNRYTGPQQTQIDKLMEANPSLSEERAISYLKHKGRWD